MALSFPARIRQTISRDTVCTRQTTCSPPRPLAQATTRDNYIRTLDHSPPTADVPAPDFRDARPS